MDSFCVCSMNIWKKVYSLWMEFIVQYLLDVWYWLCYLFLYCYHFSSTWSLLNIRDVLKPPRINEFISISPCITYSFYVIRIVSVIGYKINANYYSVIFLIFNHLCYKASFSFLRHFALNSMFSGIKIATTPS